MVITILKYSLEWQLTLSSTILKQWGQTSGQVRDCPCSTSGDSPRGTSAGRGDAEIGVETSEEFKTLLVRRQKRLSQSAR